MHKLILCLGFVWAGLWGHAQQIDSEESSIQFEIGGIGWSTVEGNFKGMTGTVELTDKVVGSSFNVCIKPSTVFTDNEERDEHLQNEDFFNVSKYVNVCFKSSSVTKKGNEFVVKGNLTILNVTKEISFPFTVSEKEGKKILQGSFELNRFDYGLAEDSYSSTIMVDDIAEVNVICVLK